VRSSYIALIKRHHPDATRGDAGSQQIVSAVNRAYWVLKHPQRRAEYDRAHSDGAGAERLPVAIRPTRASRSRLADRLIGGGLIVIAGASLLVVARQLPAPVERVPAPDQEAALPDPGPMEPVIDPELDRRMPAVEVNAPLVRQAVTLFFSLAASADPAALEGYSRACFEEASLDPDLTRLDYCIGYDIAMDSWNSQRRGGRDRRDPAERRSRHLEAMNQVSNDPVANLERWAGIERIAAAEIAIRGGPRAAKAGAGDQASEKVARA
jgi:hypothetical protein